MKYLLFSCLAMILAFNNFSQKIGVNNTNPQVSMDIKGALALRPEAPISVTAPITTFNVTDVSYLKFSSNSNNATERLVNVSPGKTGQHLILEFSGDGAARMMNGSGLSNGGKLLLSAGFDFDDPAMLGLIFDGTNWKELYRRQSLRRETDMDSVTYNVAGAYSFVVPPGITKITVLISGAGAWGGGASSNPLGKGGNGGFVSGDIVVTEGETLSITVGAGAQHTRAGITAIRRASTILGLAGAGGNGSQNGGYGGSGGATGGDGILGTSFYSLGGVGKGATAIAGGAGGAQGQMGTIGGSGTALTGGTNNSGDNGDDGDGWGGSGWFGGGAAGTYDFPVSQDGPYASGGGGGGSNYTGGLTGTVVSNSNGSAGGTGNTVGTSGIIKIKW